ncbi:hypothetical protein K458DRAFT_127367 [Lentithecium fluviatile CBS 122367]|uniref:Uncharacterized protein n=1 Tax=Lentithecium fluviatile CBS 122367 TaxID=1168545 RepID=A0A6G1JFQ7_9PLEO|nr:hypothetical protein K458DRAFT_127367 [Lentithecium fluviatile CBS 122367]
MVRVRENGDIHYGSCGHGKLEMRSRARICPIRASSAHAPGHREPYSDSLILPLLITFVSVRAESHPRPAQLHPLELE